MKRNTPTPWAAAVVIALAAAVLYTIPTHAGTQPGATLGPLQTGGTLYPGGTNFYYILDVTAFTPGALSVEAQVKAKTWKASFPVLATVLTNGANSVTSAAIVVPGDFQGSAVLKIKATYNGKKIGKNSILFTAGTPPTVVPAAATQTTWYDVGFNSNVVINADSVSTNGMTFPLTYLWSIADTDVRTNATFDSTTTGAPKFSTLPITRFTNTLEVVGSVTNVLDPIDLEKEFDLALNPNLVAITSEQVAKTTYHLQVIVSDSGSIVRTGTVSIVTTSFNPGQPTIPLGERQYVTAEPNGTNASTYSWSLSGKPSGSSAVLANGSSRTPSLRPDKEGEYALQLSVRSAGETNTSYVTVRGASYVGVSTCASCHGVNPQVGLEDYYTPWTQTGHATFFIAGVDGLLSPHYNESCISCHTVGYNKAPAATNGNFAAVQKLLGWSFPSVLQLGNYDAMPADLQDKANIQCESCHGPGSQHPGAASTSMDVAVCATCHQDGNHHNRPKQWRLGPHGNDDDYLHASIEEAPSASCAKCHSPTSFVDNLKGKPLTRLEAGRLTCQACHDPHNEAMFPAEAHQVRIYDNVTLDDSVYPDSPPVLTGQGTSALCMYCHNARRGPPATYISSGSNGTRVPHESTATDVLLGIRASTNVMSVVSGVTNTIATVTLQNSPHSTVAKCVNCHMHDAGVNTVGDHTFSTTDRLTGEDNVAACNVCHTGVDPVTSFDHVGNSGEDFDGDGAVEGVQSEVDGLLANLVAKMEETGLTFGSSGSVTSTSYSTNPVTRAVQRNAAWNQFLIERELSHGVHNTEFTVKLLQWSYTVLSTNMVPAGNPYWVDYPAAYIK